MRRDDRRPVQRHSHSHGDRPENTLFARIFLVCFFSPLYIVLWNIRERLPFPVEALYVMIGCYLAAGSMIIFMPKLAQMLSPLMGVLIYLMIFTPFVSFFWNPHVPQVVGMIIGGIASLPVLFLSIAMVQRTYKMLCGVDVIAEDKAIEERAYMRAEQFKNKYNIESRSHEDEH